MCAAPFRSTGVTKPTESSSGPCRPASHGPPRVRYISGRLEDEDVSWLPIGRCRIMEAEAAGEAAGEVAPGT